ncbi:uncharacterized protein BKA55DRAFT_560889 [Fusarium redolens]|uniref:Uncharacterized protein n=1 Tax=Fusarium redolens TaxID=48865 RepID=A0A9P9HR45_FUSRE|nr:uncharacterized protein BKA55DRAFT_560889 [Fusarium redolens]KAH7261277.1 hypothetical protein BKA55DRAFT_560889 [Fusarium redolens]
MSHQPGFPPKSETGWRFVMVTRSIARATDRVIAFPVPTCQEIDQRRDLVLDHSRGAFRHAEAVQCGGFITWSEIQLVLF